MFLHRKLLLNELYVFPTLDQLLISEEWDLIDKKITVIFDHFSRIPNNQRDCLSEICFVLTYYCLRYCHRQQISAHYIMKMEESLQNLIEDSPLMMKRRVIAILYRVMKEVQKNKKNPTIKIVRKTQQYIEDNINGDVSLQAISDHLYLHPTTLTRLFKLETGNSIGEYLLLLRMEKATLLLENRSLKICAIANQLGFQSTSYFIQLFKSKFGVTPNRYRLYFNETTTR